MNLPGISAGQDPFWAVLDASRFSWQEAAAEKHKHTAVSWDVAVTSLTSAYILKTNSLEAFGILAGILCLSTQQLLNGTGRSKHTAPTRSFSRTMVYIYIYIYNKSLQARDLQLYVGAGPVSKQ